MWGRPNFEASRGEIPCGGPGALQGIAGGAIMGAVASAVVYGGFKAYGAMREAGAMSQEEASARALGRTQYAHDSGTVIDAPSSAEPAPTALRIYQEIQEFGDFVFSKEGATSILEGLSNLDKAVAVGGTVSTGFGLINAGYFAIQNAPGVGVYSPVAVAAGMGLIGLGVTFQVGAGAMAWTFWGPQPPTSDPQFYGP